jgi:hypothetical protein
MAPVFSPAPVWDALNSSARRRAVWAAASARSIASWALAWSRVSAASSSSALVAEAWAVSASLAISVSTLFRSVCQALLSALAFRVEARAAASAAAIDAGDRRRALARFGGALKVCRRLLRLVELGGGPLDHGPGAVGARRLLGFQARRRGFGLARPALGQSDV